ncbi:MAG: carbamoyl-phosphate synthase small subunit [Candidatus Dadabacteria bacterium]|nr:MAG: carbamoyl-phosphate synthase small subunit [Candidatus Dadabacteria bacterium]
MRRKAVLALADGKLFHGYAFGATRSSDAPAVGEVVFNTSMFGYQEILTDPSYAGQIMCFTAPHIGNVGCNELDVESERVFVEGVIIRDLSLRASNFRATQTLDGYLRAASVMGIAEIDTRELVSYIRDVGAQMGAMACGDDIDCDQLVDYARAAGSMEGKDYVKRVTCDRPYSWDELPWTLSDNSYKRLSQEKLVSRPHVVTVDCGVKRNILRLLLDAGFRVTVVPATFSASDISALNPDALFLSNGPGDPATVTYVVETVRELLGRLPIFGICLGHQILAQACGAKTYKLKFGHRGGNHPVLEKKSDRIHITVQNHGFAVREDTVGDRAIVSQINLNDQTVEALDIEELNTFCIQYHPEASPGPHDASHYFKRFFENVVGYYG